MSSRSPRSMSVRRESAAGNHGGVAYSLSTTSSHGPRTGVPLNGWKLGRCWLTPVAAPWTMILVCARARSSWRNTPEASMRFCCPRAFGASLLATAAIALLLPRVAVAQTAERQVTFTKDVAAIFQDKCEVCHRPESIAPMSLRTYDEARPWARSIRARVESRQMPPWHIDKTVGIQKFKNDRSLSEQQVATIIAWV